MRPSALVARLLGCTEGQASTVLLGAVVATVLLSVSVPPALTRHIVTPPPVAGIEPAPQISPGAP